MAPLALAAIVTPTGDEEGHERQHDFETRLIEGSVAGGNARRKRPRLLIWANCSESNSLGTYKLYWFEEF